MVIFFENGRIAHIDTIGFGIGQHDGAGANHATGRYGYPVCQYGVATDKTTITYQTGSVDDGPGRYVTEITDLRIVFHHCRRVDDGVYAHPRPGIDDDLGASPPFPRPGWHGQKHKPSEQQAPVTAHRDP